MQHTIGILGSGSWATAIAKIMLCNQDSIHWFIHRQETIDAFAATGRNPRYLSAAQFDPARIRFSADINKVVSACDILIVAIPSPYVKQSLYRIRRVMQNKTIISAVKGMIPDENILLTDYLHERFNIPYEQLAVVTGPCHAEEIALEKLSYLTIGCVQRERAVQLSQLFKTPYVHVTQSIDINGLEYASVMKNICAIASGICQSQRYGDNFQAVLLANAIQEINRFATAMSLTPRDIDASAYLGDVLVTAYSKFSRNRQFGQMIGMGYSVKAAQMEMQMVAEGYYGTKCIHLLNEQKHVSLPIVDAVYDILYEHRSPTIVLQELTNKLN